MSGVAALLRDLNAAYRQYPALHARDCEAEGFQWLIADDARNSVFAWARHDGAGGPPVVVIANLTPALLTGYRLPLPVAGVWHELINSDALSYGGSGQGNMGVVIAYAQDGGAFAEITLPPLATILLRADG